MEGNADRVSGQVTSALAKFMIGATAGCCAAILPRFLAQLSQTDLARITFLPEAYLVAAGVFSVFMGALMVIFEWNVPAKPRDTFMTALGLPAVVAGAIGTASGVGNLGEIKREADQLKKAISQQQGIVREGTLGAFERLEQLPAAAYPEKKSWIPALIGNAYAQQLPVQMTQSGSPRFGIHVEEPKFAVILKRAKTDKEAIQAAQELRQRLPQAQAVKSGGAYFVILGGAERSETEALLDAARAKSVLGDPKLHPELVEIRR
jgi:hypothetical protein